MTHSCPNNDNWSAETIRQILKNKDRCDACFQKKAVHPPKCQLNFSCHKCKGEHRQITCGAQVGGPNEHPGSWVLMQAQQTQQ